MIKIIYPPQKPKIKNEEGKQSIFCSIRKKWYLLTPEEWVRQNFILSLVHVLGYPAALIAVEKKIVFHEINKRFDIVVYDRQTNPYLLIECKEMKVPLQQQTYFQALVYNSQLQAPYFIITNGTSCLGFKKIANKVAEIFEIPVYEEEV